LTGEDKSCKTSLAFQACISFLEKDPSSQIVILSPKPIQSLPLPVHHMPTIKKSFGNRLIIHHFKQSGELINFMARMQMRDTLPSVIFLEDLHVFSGSRRVVGDTEVDSVTIISKLFPLAADIIGHCSQQLKKQCLLMITAKDTDHNKSEESIPIIGSLFMDHLATLEKRSMMDTDDRENFVLTLNESETVSFYKEEGVIFMKDLRDKRPSEEVMELLRKRKENRMKDKEMRMMEKDKNTKEPSVTG